MTIDLDAMSVTGPNGERFAFALDREARAMLHDGLDAIDLTLTRTDAMEAFRAAELTRRPCAYVTE